MGTAKHLPGSSLILERPFEVLGVSQGTKPSHIFQIKVTWGEKKIHAKQVSLRGFI